MPGITAFRGNSAFESSPLVTLPSDFVVLDDAEYDNYLEELSLPTYSEIGSDSSNYTPCGEVEVADLSVQDKGEIKASIPLEQNVFCQAECNNYFEEIPFPAHSEIESDSSNYTPCGEVEVVDLSAQDRGELKAPTPLQNVFPQAEYPPEDLNSSTHEPRTVHAPIKEKPSPLQHEIGTPLNVISPSLQRLSKRRLRSIANSPCSRHEFPPSSRDFLFSIPTKISDFFLAHKKAFLLGTQFLIRATIVILVAMAVTLPVISLDNLVKSVLIIELVLTWNHKDIAMSQNRLPIYTQTTSKVGQWTGLKAAENQRPQAS